MDILNHIYPNFKFGIYLLAIIVHFEGMSIGINVCVGFFRNWRYLKVTPWNYQNIECIEFEENSSFTNHPINTLRYSAQYNCEKKKQISEWLSSGALLQARPSRDYSLDSFDILVTNSCDSTKISTSV